MNASFTFMIQGTTSDAGKTAMVAAFCRILANQGRRVVPFKPQNMALNSAVTLDGGEIGRAQALQALACRIKPHTDMNPVLLKPSSDTGAQVIIHGRAISSMEAKAYHDYKKVALEAVLDSHTRLSREYEVVVVEGAGSPAEVNLREGDIANMGFAEAVDCPVLIVADIDKGGVFAHLVGTLALLSESEQKRTVGFIINRFRGDIALLQPGLDWLEKKTGKPVIAVVPYLQQLYLDSEDGIAVEQSNTKAKAINVVVPVYSRISNHTDFDALRLNSSVNIQFIPAGLVLPDCDLIILPGSKNVRADLQWLKDNQWDAAIARHLRYGGKLLGLCGGYQMLGHYIHDPHGVEGPAGSSEGLGYIDMETTLQAEKTTELKSGVFTLYGNQCEVEGYEIHCGVSAINGEHQHVISYSDTEQEGFISEDGQVMGSYLHGLFDRPAVTQLVLSWLGEQCTGVTVEAVDVAEIREQQLDRLAHAVSDCIDYSKLSGALGVDIYAEVPSVG